MKDLPRWHPVWLLPEWYDPKVRHHIRAWGYSGTHLAFFALVVRPIKAVATILEMAAMAVLFVLLLPTWTLRTIAEKMDSAVGRLTRRKKRKT